MKTTLHQLIIFIIVYFSYGYAIGQRIRICPKDLPCHNASDAEAGLMYILANDSVKIVDLLSFKIVKSIPIKTPQGLEFDKLHPVCLNHKLYLINNSGGQTYILNNDKLEGIDQGVSHNAQQFATLFTNNGKIYRYGGYGYWSYRNFFCYLDSLTKEWEILEPTGSKVFPLGSAYTIFKMIKDDWYVFGGMILDQASPINGKLNDECWVFHFKTKSWERLGNLNPKFVSMHIAYFDFEDNLVLVSYDAQNYILDLPNNKYKAYSKTKAGPFVNGGIVLVREPYYFHEMVYIISRGSGDQNLFLYRENRDDFFGDFMGEGEIYSSDRIWIGLVAATILLILVLGLLTWLYKKRAVDKIRVAEGKIIFKTRELDLEPLHFALIQLFLSAEELTSTDLLEVINNDHLHYSQNMRILNNLIDELNFKFNLLTGLKVEFIQFEKSAIDKRMKAYKLQKKYFYGLKSPGIVI